MGGGGGEAVPYYEMTPLMNDQIPGQIYICMMEMGTQ